MATNRQNESFVSSVSDMLKGGAVHVDIGGPGLTCHPSISYRFSLKLLNIIKCMYDVLTGQVLSDTLLIKTGVRQVLLFLISINWTMNISVDSQRTGVGGVACRPTAKQESSREGEEEWLMATGEARGEREQDRPLLGNHSCARSGKDNCWKAHKDFARSGVYCKINIIVDPERSGDIADWWPKEPGRKRLPQFGAQCGATRVGEGRPSDGSRGRACGVGNKRPPTAGGPAGDGGPGRRGTARANRHQPFLLSFPTAAFRRATGD
ncbi:uncharacterized protein LOC133563667 isoform X1 [Nerophis ophidion]|uniref:uncharacterized protein LOC133563667 isoform X1 n=1 Tax=Nerophis ophidion TaxID=159077 RepID=UPI002ADFB7DF|nr:uncharacterized protein LOC133563667 isoform X1 [Nerophis ophidion]